MKAQVKHYKVKQKRKYTKRSKSVDVTTMISSLESMLRLLRTLQ